MENEEKRAGALEQEKKDATTCMAIGAGVGILGATAAAITGAVCPLCIFIAPGLVGVGAFKRWQCSRQQTKDNETKS